MTMTPRERRAVWLTTAGTLITGVVYWWMKEMLTPPDPWAVVNHPLQPWVLKAHILIAPLQVFSVGLITSRHIWRHFRTGVKKGRRTGVLAAGTFMALVATGYGLQVVTAEMIITGLAWAHLALGVIYSVGIAAHWPATRSRQAAGKPDGCRAAPPVPETPAAGARSDRAREWRRSPGSRSDTVRDPSAGGA
jgi:hypothetical protein